MESHKQLLFCIACNEMYRPQQTVIYDFGEQPLANQFHTNTTPLKKYPLNLRYCQCCSHLQLSHTINPEVLFKNYLYVSNTTQTLNYFFQDFYSTVTENKSIGSVLDIGCNDGSQLKIFKDNGWAVQGVDPAINLNKFTEQHGIPTIREFWGIDVAKQLDTKFDIIIAQNVFAHTSNVSEFLDACEMVLSKTGSLYIQMSQSNMILNGEFDTIYHEHISFFTIKSMLVLANRMGWTIVDIKEHKIHGNSYVFELKKFDDVYFYDTVYEKYLNEFKLGLHHKINLSDPSEPNVYNNYSLKIANTLQSLENTLQNLIDDNFTIIGYGATAKSMTVINSLSKNYLSYFIDENKFKCELYTPGWNIPIHFVDKPMPSNKVAILMTAWNYSDEIIAKLKSRSDVNNDTILIYYTPTVHTKMLYE
jgi:SAM-dependent methyltransferase